MHQVEILENIEEKQQNNLDFNSNNNHNYEEDFEILEKKSKNKRKKLTFEEIQLKIQKYAAKIDFKKQTSQKVRNEIEYFNSNFLRTKFFIKKIHNFQYLIEATN